ncbi:hypothetical protein V5F79_23940 [Xanthobacter flavus]|uniref:beta strand repeat-containing protein n=1 Tax=Xanthobacter flavus TaxID=281 RepID=UPI00372C7FE1
MGGDNGKLDVTNSGAISTQGAAVAGLVVGDEGQVKVTNTGAINGGLLGVGGIVIGDNTTGIATTVEVKNSAAVTNDGIGVLGGGIGDNQVVKVSTSGAIDSGLLGVGGFSIGASGNVDVKTTAAVTSGGAGVVGAGIGDNSVVKVTTGEQVDGTFLGVGGLIGGAGSQLTIVTEDKVTSSDGFGVAALGLGTGQTINVTTQQEVSGDLLGVGALNLGGGGTTVNVETQAKVTSASGFGVLGGSIGTGANTVTVLTQKQVSGDLLGVGGIIGGTGGSLTIETKDTVDSANGFGVAALGLGSNTIDVTTDKAVTGRYLGVGALALGDQNTVTVHTKDTVTSSDGFGVLGGAIGAGPNVVSVTTDKAVVGDLLGVGGVIGGTGGSLTIETKDTVDSANGFGVAALGFGSNTIDVTTDKAVTGRYLGVGALALGDTNAVTVHTKDTVKSADGFGVFGGAIGGGANTVKVTTDQTVDGRLLGVGGILGATGGSLDINTKAAVTSTDGFGVAGLAFGNNNTVKVLTEGTVSGDLLGVGALSIGDGGTVDVHTLAAVTSANGIGVLGGNIGAGQQVTVVTDGTVNAAIAGVVGFNTGGDTDVTVNQKVSVAPGGFIGAAAISGGTGNATLTINGVIDPPAIGGGALTLGSGTATVNVNAEVQATTIGIVGANIGNGAIDVNVNAGGTIKSDGIGILTFKLGDGPTNIDVDAAVGGLSGAATGGDGIFALAFGESPVTINTTANGTITAGDDGISVGHIGGGNITITTNAAITAGDEGIQVLSAALTTGDVTVTNNAAITATDNGIFILKGGDGAVTVNANANITSTTANGIEANAVLGTGNVTVAQAGLTTITAQDFGIIASKTLGTGDVTVTTGTLSAINATAGGIFAGRFGGTGNVVVSTGIASGITTSGNGINAQSIGADGNVTVTTGLASGITAGNDGIVANKFAGSGDIFLTTGSSSTVAAGDDGLTATNFAFGAGNDIFVTTGLNSSVVANDKGIRAGGWDNVNITTSDLSLIRGDADQSGVGNAIRIFEADFATVNIGTNNAVIGSGKSWGEAVISVNSDDGTVINVGAGTLVSSWSYLGGNNLPGLIVAASDIVIDTDGGATTITNNGTIVGRIGLTNNDDTFNNLSSNTWITVGNNYFGGGTDTLNNTGRIVTALQGAVAENTNFFSLETFNNGDPLFLQSGLLTMIDEVPGQIAFNGARDVTYVSGTWNGVGNSRVGLDSFLGAAGSTSDQLAVGGLDVNGVEIAGLVTTGTTGLVIHDVNPGPGAFNLAGIRVVDVQSVAGTTNPASFYIDPSSTNYAPKFGGVIDKGLFFYDLTVIGNDQYLIGLPDQEVFELPKLVTGAQAIWHETTGVWLDRQADLRTYLQGTPKQLVTKEGVKTIDGAPASVTPGIWGKVVGSWGSRDASNTFAAGGGLYGFDTGYNQSIYGFMAGADFGKESVFATNDAVVFGVLGGYVGSNLNFSNSPTSADYSGGTVGAYATYITGNWYFDALIKADFLSMDYNAPTLAGIGYFGKSTDARNVGFALDTGYRLYTWANGGFVDGLATLSYVNTNISNLAIAGNTFVDFGNNDSLRGSLGARVGGQIYDAATYKVQASVTGRLWYEFLGDNAVTIFNPGVPFGTVDNFDGLFGEVGVGFNVFAKDSGWNSFVNADVKFGDNYTAGSAKGGVRYQW